MEVKKTRLEHTLTQPNTVEKLNGLVVAGGHSTRMGIDKGTIKWFGKEHRFYLADLLRPFCNEVFISCRNEQQASITENGYKPLVDVYYNIGPFAALLSAFEKSGSSWVIIACDFPLIITDAIQYLVNERDNNCIATSYRNPEDDLPEPLAAIWEPGCYKVLKQEFINNKHSLRDILKQNKVKTITPQSKDVLCNVNTQQESEELRNHFSF